MPGSSSVSIGVSVFGVAHKSWQILWEHMYLITIDLVSRVLLSICWITVALMSDHRTSSSTRWYIQYPCLPFVTCIGEGLICQLATVYVSCQV